MSQQISIDGGHLLEDLPPFLVDRDAVAHTGDQVPWHRDLFGAAPTVRDAQVDGGVQLATGAATARLSAAHRALHQAAAQHFIQWRQLCQEPAPALD